MMELVGARPGTEQERIIGRMIVYSSFFFAVKTRFTQILIYARLFQNLYPFLLRKSWVSKQRRRMEDWISAMGIVGLCHDILTRPASGQ